MLTEEAVFCKVMPICSAIARNKLLKISNITGSGLAVIWVVFGETGEEEIAVCLVRIK